MRSVPSPLDLCHNICAVSHDLGKGLHYVQNPVDWWEAFEKYIKSAQARQRVLRQHVTTMGYTMRQIIFQISRLPSPLASDEYLEIDGCTLYFSRGKREEQKYLVTSHSDHYAGIGAVDNGSGMSVMARVGELLKDRRDVLYVCFDGEELGLRGSSYFQSRARSQLPSIRKLYNIDSVGKQSIVDFSPKNNPPALSGLSQVELQDHRTDATSFIGWNIAISSLMTVSGLTLAPGGEKYFLSSDEVKSSNVANQSHDQLDALCEDNLEAAAELIVKNIRDDAQGIF